MEFDQYTPNTLVILFLSNRLLDQVFCRNKKTSLFNNILGTSDTTFSFFLKSQAFSRFVVSMSGNMLQ